MANCWQPSDKKENNEVSQANDIKENPKEDFGEEEMLKQSNDTIITPKDVQVDEDGTIFYDHHRLIYIEKISELIKRIEYNPQNEMYQKLKRNVHFAVVEWGKGNKKHG